MLLLTNHPHNKVHKPSPRRHHPLRGCSEVTVGRIFANEDAMQRLLSEFENLEEVSSLRKCNRQVPARLRASRPCCTLHDTCSCCDAACMCTHVQLRVLVDGHSGLWQNVQYSPPGLARLSTYGLQTEKVLRKGAQEGNREAQMMLALMYHHGYTCPCHPLHIPNL